MGGVTSNVILYIHRYGVGASGEVGSKAPIPLQYVRYVHLGGFPPQSQLRTTTAVCVSCRPSIIIHYRPNLPIQQTPIRKKLPPKLFLIILSICPNDERAIAIFAFSRLFKAIRQSIRQPASDKRSKSLREMAA